VKRCLSYLAARRSGGRVGGPPAPPSPKKEKWTWLMTVLLMTLLRVCMCVVCSCTGSTRLEDVLCCSVWHDTIHVQRWEQLQALDTLLQCYSSPPLHRHQGWGLCQEEPRVPPADCRHGPVSHSDQVCLMFLCLITLMLPNMYVVQLNVLC